MFQWHHADAYDCSVRHFATTETYVEYMPRLPHSMKRNNLNPDGASGIAAKRFSRELFSKFFVVRRESQEKQRC